MCNIQFSRYIIISHFCIIVILDILLLGCYTRFSCSVIKWNSQKTKLTISPIYPFYPCLSPHNGWTNWLINEFHVRNDNFSCVIISRYNFISFVVMLLIIHMFPCLFIHYLVSSFLVAKLLYNLRCLFVLLSIVKGEIGCCSRLEYFVTYSLQ